MDHELAKYRNWPYIAEIIEFQKKIDDVIEWRHFVQILSKFRRMFLLSRCLIYVYRNSIRSGRGVIHTMAILRLSEYRNFQKRAQIPFWQDFSIGNSQSGLENDEKAIN